MSERNENKTNCLNEETLEKAIEDIISFQEEKGLKLSIKPNKVYISIETGEVKLIEV